MAEISIEVLVGCGVYIIATNLAEEVKGQCPKDFGKFGEYKEHNNQLVYIQEICSDDGSSIQRQIDYCRAYPRIAHQEVFPQVPILDWDTEEVLGMLYHVDLIGILQGIKEYFQTKEEEKRRNLGQLIEVPKNPQKGIGFKADKND